MANQNSIADLSTTPASNLNVLGQSQQGTAPASTIDNIFQRYGAMLAAFYDSIGGSATATGTTSLAVTITEKWAAHSNGNILAIKVPNAASGATTITVTTPDGALANKKIRRQGDSAIQANDWLANATILLRYDSAYDSAAGAWVLLNPAATGLPSLTLNSVLLGNGTSAPQTVAPGTAGNVLTSDGTTWISAARLTLGTPVTLTSQTSIDFTGIAARRIEFNLAGVSTNGTARPMIQIGDSGGIETTGYSSASSNSASGVSTASLTTAFGLAQGWTSSRVISGIATLTLVDSATNLWAFASTFGGSDSAVTYVSGGSKSLSSTLTQVRLTTVNGTDAYTAGIINVSWE